MDGKIANEDYAFDKSPGKKMLKMRFDPSSSEVKDFEDEEYYFSVYHLAIVSQSEVAKYVVTLTQSDNYYQLMENYISENWVETGASKYFYFELPT